MNSTKQARSAIIVVLIGVAATVLVFGRRPAPTLPTAMSDSTDGLVTLRGKMSLSIPGQPPPSHHPIPDAGEPIDWRAIESEQGRVAEQFTVKSVPVSSTPRPDNLPQNAAAPSTIAPQKPATAQTGRPVRYHRIVEGDNLRDLASRYLGSSDRYLELFYANRSVLPHPDVLPLHARIVIPDRTDPLAAAVNPADAAEARAASPWNSRPLPAEGVRLPEIASP